MAENVEPGDIVVDGEQVPPEQNLAIVTKVLDRDASDVYIPEIDQTVAEANPGYPPHDDVALILFGTALASNGVMDDDLRGRLSEINAVIDEMEDEWNVDIRTWRYGYPVSRLAKRDADAQDLLEDGKNR